MTAFAPVFGEDLSVAWPSGLLVVGVAMTVTFVAAVTSPSTAAVAPAPTRSVPSEIAPSAIVRAAPPAEPLSSVVTTETSASSSTTTRQATPPPTGCHALTIGFESGTIPPPPTALGPLASLAKALHDQPTATLRIDGHADARGDETENLLLSRRRAEAVAAVLERTGIARGRLAVHAFGALQPVDGVDDTSAVQRRVVVTLRGVERCPDDLPESVSP